MIYYSFQRILAAVPVLVGISLLAFILGVLAPGDPAEFVLNQTGLADPTEAQIADMRRELGLDRPLWQQYGSWFAQILKGDLGTSYMTGRNISEEILLRLPVTIELAVMALGVTIVLGITAGILCAVWRDTLVDQVIKNIMNVLLAIPSFWMALLMIFVFGEILKMLPTGGSDGVVNFILPAVVVSLSTVATVCQYMRNMLIHEFESSYFLVARVRGIRRWNLILRYALPNAILPVIALLGNYFVGILGGSVIAESIFALPGISSMALDAIRYRDYPVLQAYVLVSGVILILVTVTVDIFIAWVNPRIKFGRPS